MSIGEKVNLNVDKVVPNFVVNVLDNIVINMVIYVRNQIIWVVSNLKNFHINFKVSNKVGKDLIVREKETYIENVVSIFWENL